MKNRRNSDGIPPIKLDMVNRQRSGTLSQPVLPLTPLSARPRSDSSPRDAKATGAILISRLNIAINNAHQNRHNPEALFSDDDINWIIQCCEEIDLTAHKDEIIAVLKAYPLTPKLYQQLFGALSLHNNHLERDLERAKGLLDITIAKSYKPLTRKASVEPDFSRLNPDNKPAKQHYLPILWQMSQGYLTTEEIYQASLILAQSPSPKNLIHYLGQMVSWMDDEQLKTVPIMVYYLCQQCPDIADTNTVKHLWDKLNLQRQQRNIPLTPGTSTLPEVIKLIAKHHNNTYKRNVAVLKKWCLDALETKKATSFTHMLIKGIHMSQGKHRDELALEVASELMHTSTGFYNRLSIQELVNMNDNYPPVLNEFIKFVNNAGTCLRNTLLQCEDFPSAISFLIDVANNMSVKKGSLSYACLTSQMIISLVLNHYQVSKKLKEYSLSPSVLDALKILTERYDPKENYKNARSFQMQFQHPIPNLFIFCHDLRFGIDGNHDALNQLLIKGKVISSIAALHSWLESEFISHNTNIFDELCAHPNWLILKSEERLIKWEDPFSLINLITNIESTLNENQKPTIQYGKQVIQGERVYAFLWSHYVKTMSPSQSDLDIEQALLIESKLLELSDKLAHLATADCQTPSTRPRNDSRLSRIKSFFFVAPENTHKPSSPNTPPSRAREQADEMCGLPTP